MGQRSDPYCGRASAQLFSRAIAEFLASRNVPMALAAGKSAYVFRMNVLLTGIIKYADAKRIECSVRRCPSLRPA